LVFHSSRILTGGTPSRDSFFSRSSESYVPCLRHYFSSGTPWRRRRCGCSLLVHAPFFCVTFVFCLVFALLCPDLLLFLTKLTFRCRAFSFWCIASGSLQNSPPAAYGPPFFVTSAPTSRVGSLFSSDPSSDISLLTGCAPPFYHRPIPSRYLLCIDRLAFSTLRPQRTAIFSRAFPPCLNIISDGFN